MPYNAYYIENKIIQQFFEKVHDVPIFVTFHTYESVILYIISLYGHISLNCRHFLEKCLLSKGSPEVRSILDPQHQLVGNI